jgi:hypothetical protein
MVGGGGGWQAVHQTLPRSHPNLQFGGERKRERALPGIGLLLLINDPSAAIQLQGTA